uniref:Uncharacterized protein n=1 Tax=Glossina palpalis gambiensis TaxID=67801 RepID=A0A1B0AYD9_9MUSC
MLCEYTLNQDLVAELLIAVGTADVEFPELIEYFSAKIRNWTQLSFLLSSCHSKDSDLQLILTDIIASLIMSSEIGILVAIGMSLLFISWNYAESITGNSTNSCKNL